MNKLAALLLSLYVSTFLYREVPFVGRFTTMGSTSMGIFENRLSVFFVFFVVLLFVFSRIIASDVGEGEGKAVRACIYLVSIIGVTGTILYYYIPLGAMHTLPYHLDMLFSSAIALTLWLCAPLLLLAF